MNVEQILQHGLQLQQSGKLEEAGAAYRQVLSAEPKQPDALHLLGLVESAKGQHAAAVQLIQQAIQVLPQNTIFWCNLGVTLRQAGRIKEAITAYAKALEVDPNNAEAWFNLGKSLRLQDNLDAAEKAYLRAVTLKPKYAAAWQSLVSVLVDKAELPRALKVAQRAIECNPTNAELFLNLGVVYKRLQRLEETFEAYNRACQLAPSNVDALCKLAGVCISRHEVDKAKEYVKQAQAVEPDSVHVINTLGIIHNTLGDATTASKAFEDAVRRYPENATAHTNLGLAYKKLGRLTEALACLEKGFALDSKNPDNLANHAGVLLSLGRLDEAQACFERAIGWRERNTQAHSSLLMLMQYRTDLEAGDLLNKHIAWSDRYFPAPRESTVTLSGRAQGVTGAPIKLGFVSPDLGNHPVGYFTVPLFEALDRNQFEVHIYSDRLGKDPVTSRIERTAHAWSDTAHLPDEKFHAKIVADQIDVLFDLAGHTAHNRLEVFERRAAPVQISWAGYVGTTGLREMDYLLADRYHIPSSSESLYREKILRMPHGYVAFDPPAAAPEVGPLPAMRNQYVTFAAMCNPAKVNPPLLKRWASILQRLPNSRLMLCYNGWADAANRSRVWTELATALNDNPERLLTISRSVPSEVLELYNSVDIALDTFPYSGGLTTCEALWMGVPVITLPAERFAGRHSLSHVSNVGHPEWAATSPQEYEDLAVNLANDLPHLASIRSTLRHEASRSPLCNGPQFASDFQALVQRIVTSYDNVEIAKEIYR